MGCCAYILPLTFWTPSIFDSVPPYTQTHSPIHCKLVVSFVVAIFQFDILLRFHTPIKWSFRISWCKWVELFKVKPSSSSLIVPSCCVFFFSFIWPNSIFFLHSFIARAVLLLLLLSFLHVAATLSFPAKWIASQMKSFSYCQRCVCVFEHFHFTTTISHSLTFSQPFPSFPFGPFNLKRWLLVVGGVYLCSPVTIKHTYTYTQKNDSYIRM